MKSTGISHLETYGELLINEGNTNEQIIEPTFFGRKDGNISSNKIINFLNIYGKNIKILNRLELLNKYIF